MKLCNRCGKKKSTSEFYREGNRFRAKCKECIREERVVHYKENREIILKQKKDYWAKNKDKIVFRRTDYARKYGEDNREYLDEYARKYGKDNRKYLSDYHNRWAINRRITDINFRLREVLRSRLSSAIRNNKKTGSAVRDLGCSIEELKQHLENKFSTEMSWNNYGKWHIDHIIPLCSFDLSDRDQLRKACHYTNLQPLWEKDNLSKGGRT